jgi:predicted Zn finger-like uncharacterized protein
MVITCPSCSARYRLNPEKIQGRGAKITCPKCSHVFVVFTDTEEARAQADGGSQPRVKNQSRPASPSLEASSRKADTTTGAFKAVGIKQPDAPPKKTITNDNIRIVAPGSRSTRRVRTIDSGEMPVAPPPTVERSSSSDPADEVEIRSASDLDFRSVGIKTWKVKVAIGLIYDFSDIATLKKYLADKKVTPDDLISQNNKDWIRIGDIGDLDQHFIEAWRAAKAAVDSGQVALPEKKKPATGSQNTLGHASATHNAVGHTTGSFRTGDTGSAHALSTGAYGAAKEAPRRRKKAPPPVEEPPKRPMGAVVALLLLVGLLAVWRLWPDDVAGHIEDVPPIPVSEIKLPDAEREQIREAIQKKLEDKRREIVEEAELKGLASGATGDEGEDAVEKRELVAVPPSEQSVPVPNQNAIRDPVTPVPNSYRKPYEPPPKPKSAGSSGSVVQKEKVDPAKMYYDMGMKKLSAGDYGSARNAFLQAIKKNDKCTKCFEGLEKAEKQLGNADAAAAAAKKASELGSSSMASP